VSRATANDGRTPDPDLHLSSDLSSAFLMPFRYLIMKAASAILNS
jgi:hypothetical protein